ncbi:MAG: hypothetical protein ABI839_01080 [Verrucomicrobiota bacterium]
MVQANCRARFTAADFDFVVRTLARSQTEHVSLVDLLADAENRDTVLDSPRLVDAILNSGGQLRISSEFYFYVLARHVMRAAGLTERKLCDYVGSLLEKFSRAASLSAPQQTETGSQQYVSDMLMALRRASAEQAFLLRAHVGNYSLFVSGIFHENANRRRRRGAPDLGFYEQIGQQNYRLIAGHAAARRCELHDVYAELADRFHEVRVALNHLAEELLNLDEPPGADLSLDGGRELLA